MGATSTRRTPRKTPPKSSRSPSPSRKRASKSTPKRSVKPTKKSSAKKGTPSPSRSRSPSRKSSAPRSPSPSKSKPGNAAGSACCALPVWLSAPLSIVAYGYFFVCFSVYWLWLIPNGRDQAVKLLGIPAPYDKAPYLYAMEDQEHYGPIKLAGLSDTNSSLLVDIALILAFAVPHSVLARDWIKTKMGLPTSIERAFFVFQSTFLLHMQMHLWQPLDTVVWKVGDAQLSNAIIALSAVGFVWLLTSTFALDHFELCGLSQGFGFDINDKLGLASSENESGIIKRAHYSIVAHPIMLGMMVGCWATPVMTTDRLLFAVLSTAYMIYAVKNFEEPSIRAKAGKAYDDYLATVPSFCPFWPK